MGQHLGTAPGDSLQLVLLHEWVELPIDKNEGKTEVCVIGLKVDSEFDFLKELFRKCINHDAY